MPLFVLQFWLTLSGNTTVLWVKLSNKQQAKYVEVRHKQEETYWLCLVLKLGKVLQRTEETVQMLVTGKESEIKKIYCWKVAWVGHLYENYMN